MTINLHKYQTREATIEEIEGHLNDISGSIPSYDSGTDVLTVKEVRGTATDALIVYAGAGQSMFMGSGDATGSAAGEMQVFGGSSDVQGGNFLLAGGYGVGNGNGGNCELYAGSGAGTGVNGILRLNAGLAGGTAGITISDDLSVVTIGFFGGTEAAQQTLPANLTGTPTTAQLRDAINAIQNALRNSTLMI